MSNGCGIKRFLMSLLDFASLKTCQTVHINKMNSTVFFSFKMLNSQKCVSKFHAIFYIWNSHALRKLDIKI